MIDLPFDQLATVFRILLHYAPGVPAYAFSSRTNGLARKFSNLDLALVPEQTLDWRTLARLREAFEESTLPITVDVIDWTQAGTGFKQQVGPLTAAKHPLTDRGSRGRVAAPGFQATSSKASCCGAAERTSHD